MPGRPLRGRVLLVDDAPDVLLTVGAFLRHAGLEPTWAESAERALALLRTEERFDAIVTDLAMPGMNGLDLLKQARNIDPSMAGLLITGFSDPGLLQGQDNVAVLHKPFNRAELIEQLSLLIGVAPLA
jgi:CheY-like chemotaxis protein